MPLQGRRLEGRRRPVTTTCERGFRCCRPHGQGGHLWLPRRRRLPLRDDVDRATGAAPRCLRGCFDPAGFAGRPVNRESLVRSSSDARGCGTRGVELWDASRGLEKVTTSRVLVCRR